MTTTNQNALAKADLQPGLRVLVGRVLSAWLDSLGAKASAKGYEHWMAEADLAASALACNPDAAVRFLGGEVRLELTENETTLIEPHRALTSDTAYVRLNWNKGTPADTPVCTVIGRMDPEAFSQSLQELVVPTPLKPYDGTDAQEKTQPEAGGDVPPSSRRGTARHLAFAATIRALLLKLAAKLHKA